MKKLITAFAIISILAATTVPSWGKDKPIYVCYLEKKQQARVVKKTKDCKKPEMAIALNEIEPNTATDQEISERAQEVARKYPTWLQTSIFQNGSGAIGSGATRSSP